MADHTLNAMHAAIRSMRDVVLPAIDPAHPLAAEQAGLIVKYLEFWAARMDVLPSRNRAELTCYAAMGEGLRESAGEVSVDLAEVLEGCLEASRTLLASPEQDVRAVRGAVSDLTRVITALVRTAADLEHSAQTAIERVVIKHSRDVALLQRSWFAPQGWEDPVPPPLDQVLTDILQMGAER